MKKIILIATAFVCTLAVNAQSKADSLIKLNVETHDFGKLKQGVPVTYNFEIKNISNQPVVVANATASCGCTVPEKPEKPIEPGKIGLLKVQFNAPAVGQINKDVYITLAGVETPKIVHITGEVMTPEAYDAWAKDKSQTPTKDQKDQIKTTTTTQQPVKDEQPKIQKNTNNNNPVRN